MADETLLTLASDIVSAHVSNNSVAVGDLPALIQSVYASLAKLGEAQAPIEEKREPAVSIRSSVKPDAVTCLECGARFKMLKRHLSTDHDLTPDAYRARWSLPTSYPLVAPDYAAKRKELAVKIGLGRKPAQTTVRKPAQTTVRKPAPVAMPVPAPAAVKAKTPRRKKLAPAFG
jgi:predicted transcriptional regulator